MLLHSGSMYGTGKYCLAYGWMDGWTTSGRQTLSRRGAAMGVCVYVCICLSMNNPIPGAAGLRSFFSCDYYTTMIHRLKSPLWSRRSFVGFVYLCGESPPPVPNFFPPLIHLSHTHTPFACLTHTRAFPLLPSASISFGAIPTRLPPSADLISTYANKQLRQWCTKSLESLGLELELGLRLEMIYIYIYIKAKSFLVPVFQYQLVRK